MMSRSGAKLGSLCALIFGLGGACTVERNLPLGDLTDPEAGAGAGSGGSSSGGTASNPSNAGSGVGATAGTGGSAASESGLLAIGCDYITVLNQSCARSACHNARSTISGLDLTPTPPEGLVARLKDVPAGHREIDCGSPGQFVECVPATCPAPGTARLVDSANPDDSWILKKLSGAHDECGSQMPLAPGDQAFDASGMACIEKLVRAIAATDGSGEGDADCGGETPSCTDGFCQAPPCL